MSEEDRRIEMLELRDLLNQVAEFSDMISVLRAAHSIDETKLRELETAREEVNARANKLRGLVARHDETPVPQ